MYYLNIDMSNYRYNDYSHYFALKWRDMSLHVKIFLSISSLIDIQSIIRL